MAEMTNKSGRIGRRRLLTASASLTGFAVMPPGHALPAAARGFLRTDRRLPTGGRLQTDWRDHFAVLTGGALLLDIAAGTLRFWEEDAAPPLLFTAHVSNPANLLRGDTRVIRKVEGPVWRPTASLRQENPELPLRIEAGPGNPFGSHALHLERAQVRIHGTPDRAQSTHRVAKGGIALSNPDIAELFARVAIGTRIRLI